MGQRWNGVKHGLQQHPLDISSNGGLSDLEL